MDGWQIFEAVAAKRGLHPAVLMGDRVASFAAFRDLALQLALGMARHGVGPDARVVLHVGDSVEAAALPLAI